MSGAPDNKIDLENFKISVLPDGTVLQFPKDTPPEVQDRVFQEQLGQYLQSRQAASAQPPEVGTAKAFGIGGTQGLTFNFGDEAAAAIGATIGRPGGGDIKGATWGERYDNALQEARGVQHAAQEQHPIAYGAGQVAGAAAPALIAPELYGSNWIASAPSMASSMGRAAVSGGAQGLIQGFGAGEGGPKERATSAAIGGTTGAAIGAAAVPVQRAIGAAFGGRAPNPTVPTNDQLRAAGNAAYDMSDQAGVILQPQSLLRLRDTIQTDFANAGVDQTLQPRALAALNRITQAAEDGQPITLRGLDILRRVFSRAGNTQDASEREFAGRAIDHIDDFIDALSPHDLVQGDETVAVPALQVARQVWSSLRKSETLDDLVNTAELQAASTNSGGNLQNTIRQKLRQVLTNPRLRRGFTQEERDAIEQIVRGTPTQNALRIIGRLAPSSNSWLGVISTLAGGPAGALVPVVGAGAKAAADRSTQNAVTGLSDLVRSGAGITAAPAAQAPSAAMARALMGGQAGATGLGSYYANELLRPRGAPQ